MSVLGNEAEELLKNEAFTTAISDYSKFIVDQWANENNQDRREELWKHQQIIKQVVNNINGYVSNDAYEAQLKAKAGWFK